MPYIVVFIFGVCIARAVLYSIVAASSTMAVEPLECMVRSTEKLNFKFHVMLA